MSVGVIKAKAERSTRLAYIFSLTSIVANLDSFFFFKKKWNVGTEAVHWRQKFFAPCQVRVRTHGHYTRRCHVCIASQVNLTGAFPSLLTDIEK
jgi:hypothetical protein